MAPPSDQLTKVYRLTSVPVCGDATKIVWVEPPLQRAWSGAAWVIPLGGPPSVVATRPTPVGAMAMVTGTYSLRIIGTLPLFAPEVPVTVQLVRSNESERAGNRQFRQRSQSPDPSYEH